MEDISRVDIDLRSIKQTAAPLGSVVRTVDRERFTSFPLSSPETDSDHIPEKKKQSSHVGAGTFIERLQLITLLCSCGLFVSFLFFLSEPVVSRSNFRTLSPIGRLTDWEAN